MLCWNCKSRQKGMRIMICKDFQGLKLSQLGFGTMRLPLREDRSIDEEQLP